MSSSESTAPYPKARDSGDVRLNLTRAGVVIGVAAALLALAGAWLVLPYRVEQTEKFLDVLELKVERRFEANEAEARQQREILIRIDEGVKQLQRDARGAGREP